ncbi:MAG TPA: GrpB family protein [Candidatus Limnocylindria bacterium]|nr:GrpB family protein [Candidatus Limnocylindria bacterium]
MPTFRESVAAGARVIGDDRATDPIEIVEYDPMWPARYEEMRARLARALGTAAVRIDHVGSTAVPGLAAKPIIDIQISVQKVEDAAAFNGAIESQGFASRMIEPGHHYFRPPPGLPRDYQVHVCTVASDWERRHLLFRDFLRADPETRAGYEATKRDLAARYTHDRIGYNDNKGPFIEAALERGEEWAKRTGWRP